MSQTENNIPESEKRAEAEAVHTAAAVQTPENAVAPVVIKQSGGRAMAAGALLLAVLGLGASGFLFVQGQNVLKNQELAFSQKIDKAALGESENASLLKDNINKQTALQTAIDRIDQGQKANSDQIAAIRQAYAELLKGRADWVVDEAESMLNLAAQQLVLTGNMQAVASVLEHLDSRLSRFDQPDLLPLKQAVSSDLAALKNRPYVDISGTALRIDRLETAVSALPLVLDGVLKPSQEKPSETVSGAGWWQRALDKSLDALKGLVEVRSLDNNDAMLISPEQAYFVRENLRLRLLDARTALMQHNGEVYQSDLNNAEAAVRQYFDIKSPATQSWLKELAELKTLDVRMEADDSLKASLNAVRSYQEAGRMPAAATAAAPENQAASQPASAPAAEAPSAAASAPAAAIEAPVLPSESNAQKPAAPAKPEQAKNKGERA